jgi:carbonic anhydrase
MKRAGLVGLGLALAAVQTASAADWSYNGAHGPAHWGEIAEVCGAGNQQSPIDIVSDGAYGVADLGVQLNWQGFTPTVVNNGHTIQVNTNSNAGGASLYGREFSLAQLHFHRGSEHLINGRHSPMEVHFVHTSPDGDLFVVGVMVEEGDANAAFGAIMDLAPAEGSTDGSAQLDLSSLVPAGSAAWRYKGSLTTPPCSEIVTWHVMQGAVTASAKQIAAFNAMYSDNFRPAQSMNRRFVLSAN